MVFLLLAPPKHLVSGFIMIRFMPACLERESLKPTTDRSPSRTAFGQKKTPFSRFGIDRECVQPVCSRCATARNQPSAQVAQRLHSCSTPHHVHGTRLPKWTQGMDT